MADSKNKLEKIKALCDRVGVGAALRPDHVVMDLGQNIRVWTVPHAEDVLEKFGYRVRGGVAQ